MVLGIYIALNQYYINKDFNEAQIKSSELYEKRKNSTEILNKVFNSEFINSFAILKGSNGLIDNNEKKKAKNLVFITYHAIAIVYNNNIADNQIIKKSIRNEILEFVNFTFFTNMPDSTAKSEIIKMANDINN